MLELTRRFEFRHRPSLSFDPIILFSGPAPSRLNAAFKIEMACLTFAIERTDVLSNVYLDEFRVVANMYFIHDFLNQNELRKIIALEGTADRSILAEYRLRIAYHFAKVQHA